MAQKPPSNPRPIVVFVGPTASGKSTVVARLVEAGAIALHPSWTTRPRRVDEDGTTDDHVFVSETAFDRQEREGLFLDTVAMFELPYRYGLPRFTPSTSGPADAVMLRASLVERFRLFFDDIVVYQIEDELDRTRQRLLARGTSAADVQSRLDGYPEEIEHGRRIADRVFANDLSLDDLVDRILTALREDVTGRAPRSGRSPWAVVGITLAWVVGIAALGLIGFMIAVMIALNNYGSNK